MTSGTTSSAGRRSQPRHESPGGWTPPRLAAFAAGLFLGLVSGALLAGGVYTTCADIGHWSNGSAMMSWLAGELLAAGVFVAVPATLLTLVSLRRASRHPGQGRRPVAS